MSNIKIVVVFNMLTFTLLLFSVVDASNYLTLVQTWPPTYCSLKPNYCRPTIPHHFTIHGLWDTYVPWTQGPGPCLPYAQFNPKNVASVRSDLDIHWPNLRNPNPASNEQFWEYEWRKHGTCTGLNQLEYFKKALDWKTKFHLLQILTRNGFQFGVRYNTSAVTTALNDALTKDVILKCVTKPSNPVQYLWEVVLCIDSSGEELISCASKGYNAGRTQCNPSKPIIIKA